MKKFLLLVLLSISLISISNAQIAYDTVLTTKVGSGITYMKILAPAIPWRINVLKVDLQNPYNNVETAKGGGHLIGSESVSSMAARNSYDGHIVVGAVNGDFFQIGPGIPIGIQVKKGEIIHQPSSNPAVGFDINKYPMINAVNYNGKLITKNGSYNIANNNADRGTDQLILYNKYYGDSTGSNSYGTEISVKALQQWFVNDTIKCVVTAKQSNTGNMAISDTTVVLSGNGAAATFLTNNVNIGDTINVVNSVVPGFAKIKEMIGGNPVLVKNGKPYNNVAPREPRTAIGFNQDSTIMYLITVDGRQNESVGMTFAELSDLMVKLGVYQGLNLDGGGSTTMVVRDSVVNFPSGGGVQRQDANAFLVVSSQPTGTLNSIQLSPNFYRIYKGYTLQFNVQGRDNYFAPLNIDQSKVSYSISGDIGSISLDGLFTAANKADTGYVIADYNGMTDSCLIVIKSIAKIDISPKNVVTDTTITQSFKVDSYDAEGIKYYLNQNDFTWSVADPSIGTVDSMGNFKGIKAGVTKVIASYDGVSDTATINVVLEQGVKVIDHMNNLNNWKFTGENLNSTGSGISISSDQSSEGGSSLKVDYNFTYDPSKVCYIYLDTDIPIAGVPDSLKLDVKSDGLKHQIYYMLATENGNLFKMYIPQYATVADSFDILPADFSKVYAATSGAVFYYPAILKQIIIKLASGKTAGNTYSGSLYLDNLRVSYPPQVTAVNSPELMPKDYSLSQNYPNPFNPTTVIRYQIPTGGNVILKVYDILGKEVKTLVSEYRNAGSYNVTFDGAKLASGVYIYTIRVNDFTASKKLILVK